MKKVEPNTILIGAKAEKKNVFVDAIKFGFGFYIGFNLARMAKKAFIITNCK